MSDFKERSSSRFTRSSKSNGTSTTSGSTKTSGGYKNSGSKDKSYAFSRIGSITVPKSVSDDAHDFIMSELRGNREVRFNVQVYLPKGADNLTLANKDNLVISFGVSDKDKDFVVGHLLLPNNSGSRE